MLNQAKQWLDFAERDRRAAVELATHDDLLGVAAFHCQQAIEKAMKAILELHGKPIPRVHDLVTLNEQVRPFLTTPIDETELGLATDVYLTARYPAADAPGTDASPTRARVDRLIATTARICEAVTAELNRETDQ